MRFANIWYILLIALFLRAYNITAPLIGMHSWRQTDTAAMARNYCEHGMNFLYPQIDWGGNTAGYVECEFPLYPYLVAILYSTAGFTEIWGRLFSVIISLVGIYYLFRLVRDLIGTETALWSAFFAAVLPLNVFFGRAFMPEPAMLTSSIIGIYFFYRWTVDEKLLSLSLSGVFVALACLLKLPTLYLGIPLIYLAWLKYGKRTFVNFQLWIYAIFVLSCVTAWYYHAHQILLNGGSTFGIWEYGSDKWGNWSLLSSPEFWNGIIFQSLAEKHFTWPLFLVFIFSLFLKRLSLKERFFDIWLLAIIFYFIVVARGNFVHSYYQLPFMIPAVVYLGKVYARYFKSPILKSPQSLILTICLSGMIVLGGWKYRAYMQYEDPENSPEVKLAKKVQLLTQKESLFV
jgi:4-amino-4-deoxy-L-arabinose transferase-like glycosyltransferase